MKHESNRQKTMEDIDGGLHPAVDGQSLGEGKGEQCRMMMSKTIPNSCDKDEGNGVWMPLN